MRVVVIAMVLSGCGRWEFDPVADAALDAGEDSATPCTAPYSAPIRVPNVSSSVEDWGGHLTDDRLELFFSSSRAGGLGSFDLYVARRASADAAFGPPQLLADLSSAQQDDNPFVEADALRIWFDSGGAIYTAKRASRTDSWGPRELVVELDAPGNDEAASLTSDGSTVYFTSNRAPNVGGRDLWYATRASPELPFAAPVQLASITTSAEECCITVRGDGRAMWFTREGMDGRDEIAIVDRDPTDGRPIGTPRVESSTDSTEDEVDAFATTDTTILGFSSNRAGGLGSHDLFIAERACP